MTLVDRIEDGPPLLMDGAMGTELDRRKAQIDIKVWSARAMETDIELVRAVHDDYVTAGAELHIANSFAAARHVLEPAGLGDRVEAFNREAVQVCRAAIGAGASAREQWIAGSLSTYAAASDRANLPGQSALRRNYHEQADVLASAGVDMFVLEMLFDVETTLTMVEAVATIGLPVCMGFTLCPGLDGQTVETYGNSSTDGPGLSFEDVLDDVLSGLPRKVHTTIGIMHSDFATTNAALGALRRRWHGPIAVYPNSGEYEEPHWRFDTACTPGEFISASERWVDAGVSIIGGCCGIGPAHISALHEKLANA